MCAWVACLCFELWVKFAVRAKSDTFFLLRGVGKVSLWYLEILEGNKSLSQQTWNPFPLADALAQTACPVDGCFPPVGFSPADVNEIIPPFWHWSCDMYFPDWL